MPNPGKTLSGRRLADYDFGELRPMTFRETIRDSALGTVPALTLPAVAYNSVILGKTNQRFRQNEDRSAPHPICDQRLPDGLP